MSITYNPAALELKWQTRWDEAKIFQAELQSNKQKYYVLEMFPYPSGRIHMGHIRNYTIGDVIARLKRAQGANVLHPIGWDAFGLPAENAAIKNKTHPAAWTMENVQSMRDQLKRIGLSYDWSREINTCTPNYYKHSQSLFIDFLNAGLAYQKEAVVNWDPVDNTVLANEQVIEGRGWRSGAVVEKKFLKQWFLKITDFAEDLLDGLTKLHGWPDKAKLMQKNWIGKSEGVRLKFHVHNHPDTIEIFTTRPETIFGAAFIGIAYDHPFVKNISKTKVLEDFITECKQFGTAEENIEKSEKKGFRTGFMAIHPLDENIMVPIFIANFVLSEYGAGAIFGCPAHDSRDHEFAIKYKLSIQSVIAPHNGQVLDIATSPFLEDGKMINSSFLDGLDIADAKNKMITLLEDKGIGRREINYRLRDWGVSRQRYWGCPIPVIYCDACGIIPVVKEDLPVLLPQDISFDKPGNPIAHHPTWKHTSCPQCKNPATREVDTFDTFFESSWYFFRFTAPFAPEPMDMEQAQYWMAVDQYIGGAEHTVLHLLYSRFFMKALKRLGYCDYDEPFLNLLNQGMICHETYKDTQGNWLYPEEVKKSGDSAYHIKTGEEVSIGRIEKMSKSKYNVVDPEIILQKYGADTARLFLLSDSPPSRDLEWTDDGVEGAYRYLLRLWKMVEDLNQLPYSTEQDDIRITKMMHKTIHEVTQYIQDFALNKAIAKVREFTNFISTLSPSHAMMHQALSITMQLLNPMIPHITEELWERLGYTVMLVQTEWPKANPDYLEDNEVTIAIQVNGKLRATVVTHKDTAQEDIEIKAKELSSVRNFLDGKVIQKIIYIPNRIMNIVCK